MKHLLIYESFPQVVGDPMYGGDIFRIRYRNINDLSNKKSSDLKNKPENDVLDGYQTGDVIKGRAIDGDRYYEGTIVSIKQDAKGENIAIEIESNGEIVELAPSTVSFASNGDKGNMKPQPQLSKTHGELDPSSGDTFEPTTNENNFVHIKKFSEYNG